jgi:GTP-binding protein LepA
VTAARHGATEALTGYREPRPMVYSGLYPVDGSDYPDLRDALERLQLNDAALQWEPETSVALGFGFRCGFLGLLHMEITRERLEREFDLDLISTSPNVVYRVVLEDGAERRQRTRRTGLTARSTVFELSSKPPSSRQVSSSGTIMNKERAAASSAGMTTCPRSESSCATQCCWGRSSLTSTAEVALALRQPRLRRQEAGGLIWLGRYSLQGGPVDAFSAIAYDSAHAYGNKMTTNSRADSAPAVRVRCRRSSVQIIARKHPRDAQRCAIECYGGDITRKRKLLEKQKEGKKRMKTIGRVEVPQEAFVAALSTDAVTDKAKK